MDGAHRRNGFAQDVEDDTLEELLGHHAFGAPRLDEEQTQFDLTELVVDPDQLEIGAVRLHERPRLTEGARDRVDVDHEVTNGR